MIDELELEARVREALRQRAAATLVGEPRSVAVTPRRRWPVTVVVAALVAVALLIGGLVAINRDDSTRTRITNDPAPWAPGQLPRYRFDMAGARITYATEHAGSPNPMKTYLQVFTTPDNAPFPRLRISTISPSTDPMYGYSIGEPTPGLMIHGHPAALNDRGVGWVEDDGTTITVEAPGIGNDELIEIAKALERQGDGWRVGSLPQGLQPRAEGVPFEPLTGEIAYEVDGRSYELRLHVGGAVEFETWLSDRPVLDETTTVGGRLAYIAKYADHDWALLWQGSDDAFVEVRMGGVGHDGVLEAAAALTPVDEATWLASLPAGALRPSDQAAEAARLRADIPLPPGTSWDGFTSGTLMDPYQFKAELAMYASCAWWKDWLAAWQQGDISRATVAADVMNRSNSWAAVSEIATDGGIADFIKYVSDLMLPTGPGEPNEENSFIGNVESNCR